MSESTHPPITSGKSIEQFAHLFVSENRIGHQNDSDRPKIPTLPQPPGSPTIKTQWRNRFPKRTGEPAIVLVTRRGPVASYLRTLFARKKPTPPDPDRAKRAEITAEAERITAELQSFLETQAWPSLFQPPKAMYAGHMPVHTKLGNLAVWAQFDQPPLRLLRLAAYLESLAQTLQAWPSIDRFDALILGVQLARQGEIASLPPEITGRKFNTVMSQSEYERELVRTEGTVFDTVVRVITIPENLDALQPPNPADLLPDATPPGPKFGTRWHTTEPEDVDLTITPPEPQ